MTLREAIDILAGAFNRFHDHKTTTDTSHDAACVGVSMQIFPEGSQRGEISGRIVLQGAQKFANDDTKFDRVLKSLGLNPEKVKAGARNGDHEFDLVLEFDTIDQLVDILAPFSNANKVDRP